MFCNYNNYLSYQLPSNWRFEETEDNLLLYNPNGNGTITISFFNSISKSQCLDEQVSILAKRFIDQNGITTHSSLLLFETKEEQTVLTGTGTTPDDWFVKIWVIGKYPKIVLATYLSQRKNKEIKECDLIIESMRINDQTNNNQYEDIS